MSEIERAINILKRERQNLTKRLHKCIDKGVCAYLSHRIQAHDLAIEALKEKQRREDAPSKALYEQIKWQRDMAMMTLEEHGIGFCQKREDTGTWVNGFCSRCNAPIPTDNKKDYMDEADNRYCYNCGVRTKPQSAEQTELEG